MSSSSSSNHIRIHLSYILFHAVLVLGPLEHAVATFTTLKGSFSFPIITTVPWIKDYYPLRV
jgi:hypothetical protein